MQLHRGFHTIVLHFYNNNRFTVVKLVLHLVFNPLTHKNMKRYIYTDIANKSRFMKVYTTCGKECVVATRVPNPIGLYYT